MKLYSFDYLHNVYNYCLQTTSCTHVSMTQRVSPQIDSEFCTRLNDVATESTTKHHNLRHDGVISDIRTTQFIVVANDCECYLNNLVCLQTLLSWRTAYFYTK